MGHFKQSVIDSSLSEELALHRFIGAISTALTSSADSDKKVERAMELVRDFNECFPSECLDRCLEEYDKTKRERQT